MVLKRLDKVFKNALKEKVFSGAAVGVCLGHGKNRKILRKTYGYTSFEQGVHKDVNTSTLFDLASLTKPLATTLVIAALIKEGKIQLSEQLKDILPVSLPQDKANITVAQLLSHSSGLTAYKKYFEILLATEHGKRNKKLEELLLVEPLVYEPGSKSLYSDIGFMFLKWIIEIRGGVGIEDIARQKVFAPLGLDKKIFFSPNLGVMGKESFAATEDCPLRKRVLYGEVSDENTFAMGGAAGHAGLFGTIDAVLDLSTLILDIWQERDIHPFVDSKTLQGFLKRQEIPGSTWALGFDTPSKELSTGGRYLSPKSVGHLGFTGTSLWIDPEKELVMVLLTNRVHPSRDNEGIKKFRPLFHDTVIEELGLV